MRQSIQTFRKVDLAIIGLVVALLTLCVVADWRFGLVFNPAPMYPTVLLFCLLRRNRIVSLVCAITALVATFIGIALEDTDLRSDRKSVV